MVLNISGRTDIVAFYSDWFMNRIKEGFVDVRNPFNKKLVSRIYFEDVDLILFCTKNPIPILDKIEKINKPILFHVTLTPYKRDIEVNVPPKGKIIEAIKKLSNIIGKDNICVRYDPIFISDEYTLDYHIRNFDKLCTLLNGYVQTIIVSFIDDYKKLVLKNTEGLKPKLKMLGLLIISIAFVSYLVWGLKIGTETYMPFANKYVTIPIWLYIPFAILVILATTNAINLTDGIDGLSSSVSTIIITCLTIIATMFGTKEIIVFGAIVIGATLGFLMFNIYPAKAFMGDTGSLFLGGVVSGIALYLKMPLLLLIIAIIPVLETLSVIIQVAVFKKTGKRVFKMAPLHHHFELSGWRENQVVMLFSVITLISCVIGLKII